MRNIDIIKSTEDNTIKYVFKLDDTLDNFLVEFSYINKDDGKIIICVPTQTMCNLACKFCHATEHIGKIKARNLNHLEIEYGVSFIIGHLGIDSMNKPLLISYMGIGEPLMNVDNVILSMKILQQLEGDGIPLVRFAVATSIPKSHWLEFFELTKDIKDYNLPVKIHLSLHYTSDLQRKEWMPASLDIESSIACVDFYRKLTFNPVEIHYALIDGVNDTKQDAVRLTDLIKGKDFNVKFLFYNEKESLDYHASNKEKVKLFRMHLVDSFIPFEYYIPPGLSVGASCGSFLMDYDKYKDL